MKVLKCSIFIYTLKYQQPKSRQPTTNLQTLQNRNRISYTREAHHPIARLTTSRPSQTAKQQAKTPKTPQKAIISPETAHTNQPSRIRIHKKASSGLLKRPDTQKLTTTKTSHYSPSLFIYIYVCLIKDIVTT